MVPPSFFSCVEPVLGASPSSLSSTLKSLRVVKKDDRGFYDEMLSEGEAVALGLSLSLNRFPALKELSIATSGEVAGFSLIISALTQGACPSLQRLLFNGPPAKAYVFELMASFSSALSSPILPYERYAWARSERILMLRVMEGINHGTPSLMHWFPVMTCKPWSCISAMWMRGSATSSRPSIMAHGHPSEGSVFLTTVYQSMVLLPLLGP